MTRRRQLTEAQTAALFEPSTDPREMVRHYTLSSADITMVRNCRGDQNRLGWGTSRNAAIFYGRNGHFGPNPADFGGARPRIESIAAR